MVSKFRVPQGAIERSDSGGSGEERGAERLGGQNVIEALLDETQSRNSRIQ